MSRINIFNATAEDFQIEVFSAAPVDGSSGDYEDGRIVKYATHFYMWHDASGEWKKFGNSTDITSLETRLSVQESSQAIAEASMVAIDSSLQSRISTEEIARSSSIDSEETRAVLAEEAISGNLSSELVDRAADVSAEASRASSAEVVLSTNLSSGIVAREADVSVEKARAEAAEGSLQTRLAAEESNELSAETSLNLRASTEESTRLAADNSVAVTISAEASTARSAETSLESRLSSEEDRVDAILAASTADKNTFVETVSFINAIDVAHDAQTSTQISSVDSAIASAESSRIASDSSLQTRLSSEESTEASAEASLNTRMTAEASNELSAEGSLDARSSAEESLRLAEDTSLETSLTGFGSSRAAGDSSLTTAASVEASTARSAEVSVQSSLSAAALARGNADNSLETRLSVEESAMIVAVDSIEALRSAGDLSLTTRVSSEEVARAAGDSSLTTRTGVAESARSTADSSLTTRLAAEESSELSAETSLDASISSEASLARAEEDSLETRLAAEEDRVDDILDSAAADKDTFVEIVSFITSVDTESDDALASYVVAVDADISTEVSTARSAEAVLSAGISSEGSAMTSALAATYSVQKDAVDVHAGNIADAEQHEGVGRHVRIDFTSQTSFTVAAIDLPTNFEPGNGMVQVFQDMGSNKFRHLVAPASYDASTGAMSFDLGSTAKSGFVAFYSFAGDESEATEVTQFSNQRITGVDFDIDPFTTSASNEIKVYFSGITASNVHTLNPFEDGNFSANFRDFSATYAPANPALGSGWQYPTLSASWASDYSYLSLTWTNDSLHVPTIGEYGSQGYTRCKIAFGDRNSSAATQNWLDLDCHLDPSDINTMLTTSGFGKVLDDNSDSLPVNNYLLASDGIESYTYSNGDLEIFFPPSVDGWSGSVYDADSRNTKATSQGSSNYNHELKTMLNQYSIRWTSGGTTRYLTYHNSSHRLFGELSADSATSISTSYYSMYGRRNASGYTNWEYEFEQGIKIFNNYSSYFPEPDDNTDLIFYGTLLESDQSSNIQKYHGGPDSLFTDVKIVINTADGTASNMTVKYYRNSATTSDSVTWVEVDRLYLGGQKV